MSKYVVTADVQIKNGEVVQGISIRASENLPKRPAIRSGRLEEMIQLVKKLCKEDLDEA